jgi:signal transduction histidine kinase
VKQLSSDIHRLSHRLHPSKLGQLGLVAAVRGLCEEVTNTGGVEIQFKERDAPKAAPNQVALCLYRVVQEALSNVLKHSGAATGTVELFGEPGLIRLRVADSGRGFDARDQASAEGLGLISMRERLRSVGGVLSVRSEQSHGTEIEAEIPVPHGVNEPA